MNAVARWIFTPTALLAVTLAAPAVGADLIDIATDLTDPSNLADTEPSIAVDPTNPDRIAVVSFSESWSATRGAPVWKSEDGGATWRKVFQITQPRPGDSGPGDQKIAFDARGRLFVAELGSTGSYVLRQTSGYDDPLTPGQAYGSDQPHLDIDKSPASFCTDQLYAPFLNFDVSPERSTVAISSNFGVTMMSVAVGDPRFPNRTTRIALSPVGAAFVVYKTREGAVDANFERAHFRVARSDDCGMTWDALGAGGISIHGAPQVVTWFSNAWGNPAKGKVARARSSDGWIAVDPGVGALYVAYCNRDGSGFGQIYVARSADFGTTWTSTRVTDGTRHSAYPEIAIADNGTVGVLYIDYDDSGTRTIFSHRFARSFDQGASWDNQILQSMNPDDSPNAPNGFLWGDYEGLTAIGNRFYGVFTGESIDRTRTQFDPIFFRETAEQP